MSYYALETTMPARAHAPLYFVLAPAAALCALACSGDHPHPDDSGMIEVYVGPDVPARDAADVAADVAPDVPQPYDAGAPPACAVTSSARHIVDRPGGDHVADPAGMVAVPSGFLVGLRRVDLAPPDGGVTDGAVIPASRDSADVLALGLDGTPRGASSALYDAVPAGNRVLGPEILPNATGGFVLLQESHGMAGDPGFLLRVRGGTVDTTGAGATPPVLREGFSLPSMATLTSANMLGVGSQISDPTDAGGVTVNPVSVFLLPDGGNARAHDVSVLPIVPPDATDGLARATDDGGAVYVFRTAGRVAFVRFSSAGGIDPHGAYSAMAAVAPALDDAAATAGAVYAVFAHAAATGGSEVHAIVLDGATGALRADATLDAFPGTTATPASVVPSYGGAAVFWKRGGDADSHVRAAVVQPDGVVRVAAVDLVPTPHADGRVVAVVDGRTASLVMRDGTAPAWGYTFAQACLPAGGGM